MEKLEKKHIAPYLPYGLNFIIDMYEFTEGVCRPEIRHFTMGNDVSMCLKYGKPILRPLDLTKEIEHNGEKFVPSLKLDMIRKDICVYQYINPDYPIEITIQTENYSQEVDLFDGYLVMQKLLEWHFDVFGLIEKGLAVDIHTI